MIENSYREILNRVSEAARVAGRAPDTITLIAVSKMQPIEKIEGLYRQGHRDFGENYVQELVGKAQELERRGCGGIRWHFIGHLQTNKAKMLIPHVASVHSVDSEKVAQALAKQWSASGRAGRLPVFVEVNIDRESSKTGVDPEHAEALARAVAQQPELELEGLMCVPAATNDPATLRAKFRELRELGLKLRNESNQRLSMGMSGDFELAIAEGATHIRVGTALFGARG